AAQGVPMPRAAARPRQAAPRASPARIARDFRCRRAEVIVLLDGPVIRRDRPSPAPSGALVAPRRAGASGEWREATTAVTGVPGWRHAASRRFGIGSLEHAGVQRVKPTNFILEEHAMRSLQTLLLLLALTGLAPSPGLAQGQPQPAPNDRFTPTELVDEG